MGRSRNVVPAVTSALFVAALGAMVWAGSSSAAAQELRELVNLNGTWNFELGDDPSRAAPEFDDGGLARIKAPLPWEEQGFPGYDGYAWYRKTFEVPEVWKGKDLVLRLGYIDDVEEVFINGKFMAFSGSFPPNFITAYNIPREYALPAWCLEYGKTNVIAIRVYDETLQGGIIRGRLGIYERKNSIVVDQDLSGLWKFATGDTLAWRLPATDDRRWKQVQVPAYWETQGFRGYDGIGWYRTTFRVKDEIAGDRLVLMLGKVDDLDEVYLNGERIGGTGYISSKGASSVRRDEYRQWRAYSIPSNLIVAGGENVLCVRVLDDFMHGGIYSGPVGLVTREKYLRWDRKEKWAGENFWSRFHEIMQALFH